MALLDVELLSEQAGRPAGGASAFEPLHGFDRPRLLEFGEANDEAAKQEGTFGLSEFSRVVAEAVGEAVLAQVVCECGERRCRARVVAG